MSTKKPIAALAGVGYAILGVAGTIVYGDAPEEFGEPEAIAEFYNETDFGQLATANTLWLLSGVLFLVFLGVLWSAARDAEGGSGRVAITGLVAGGAAVTLGFASASIDLLAALRVDEQGAIEPGNATTYWDLATILYFLAFPMAASVLVLTTAKLSLKQQLFPAWFGVISVILGIAMLIPPISWVAVIVFTLWVAVAAVMLYVREPASG